MTTQVEAEAETQAEQTGATRGGTQEHLRDKSVKMWARRPVYPPGVELFGLTARFFCMPVHMRFSCAIYIVRTLGMCKQGGKSRVHANCEVKHDLVYVLTTVHIPQSFSLFLMIPGSQQLSTAWHKHVAMH